MKSSCVLIALLASGTSALQVTSPLASPSALVGANSINFAYVGCDVALPGHPLNKLLQTTQKVKHTPVHLMEQGMEQENQAHVRALHWALHWGCVEACGPEPADSMCVTECEVKMYQCIDGAGPGDTQADIDKCQSKLLAGIALKNGVKEQKGGAKGEVQHSRPKHKKEEVKENKPQNKPVAEVQPHEEFFKKVVKKIKSILNKDWKEDNTPSGHKEVKEVKEVKPIVQKDQARKHEDSFGEKAVQETKSILNKDFGQQATETFGRKIKYFPKPIVKSTHVVQKQPEIQPKTEDVHTYVVPLPPLKEFMPQCLAHLEQLIAMVDRSYTDSHLQTVLENECILEKDFPNSCDSGFSRNKHCHDFAEQLHEARMLELRTGSDEGYRLACEDYWNLRMPSEQQPETTTDAVLVVPKSWFSVFSMPKISTTMHCIITLTFQYFGLYTLLTILRTLVAFKYDVVGFQKIIETACTTVTYAPMLCVLFLGARMRAIQLSQGETEKYQLPQPWVQNSMIMASTAVLAQVLLVVLVGFLSGMSNVSTDPEGNLDVSRMPDAHPTAVKVLTVLRYVVMAMLYGGFTAVVVGVFMMKGPKEIWGEEELPVSPAVMCTILLASIFFTVYLLVAVTKTVFELSPKMRSTSFLLKLEASATSAKMTVNFAPMLCILFIGARMRALQIDPKHGNPQSWAQNCFYMCTFSILIQALVLILLPFVAKGECQRGLVEGDVAFRMENPNIGAFMTVVRYLCLLALYAGIITVVYSVIVITHPDGAAMTPPVSPAMQCVINLSTQYFLIYTLIFVCATIKSFALAQSMPANDTEQAVALRFQQESAVSVHMTRAIAVLDAARNTVMFAPMLCVLFIGARMRALQLLREEDGSIPPSAGPQKWVQDGMFLATWAVFIQLIMAMLVPLLTGSAPECDLDGNTKVPQGANKYLAIIAEVIRYVCLVFMYGGAIVVVVGIFTMTPESLPPNSTRTLVPNAAVPQPPLPASKL